MKPKVLIFCDYFLPGIKAGGPVTTLKNTFARLRDRIEFHLITRDRDLGDSEPYKNLPLETWIDSHKAKIFYTNASKLSVGKIAHHIKTIQPDSLYLNSSLSRRFSLLPLIATKILIPKTLRPKIVLAPRGEFSKGARTLKPLRKKVYFAAMKKTGLWRNILWQASSEFEAQDIRDIIGQKAQIHIAPDLSSSLPLKPKRPPKEAGIATIAFVGRISPMKNLTGALEAIKHVKGNVQFNIIGPPEDKTYYNECKALISQLPTNVRVTEHGPQSPETVLEELSQSDAMFLPSLGENFAHVVFEALSVGCPVILSDRTPWRDLRSKGIGFDEPLEYPEKLTQALQSIIDMSEDAHSHMRYNARTYAENLNADSKLDLQTLALFY